MKDLKEMRSCKDSVMHPEDIIEKVMEYTDASTIVATDVGQHQMWVAQYYRFKNPVRILLPEDWVQWVSEWERL